MSWAQLLVTLFCAVFASSGFWAYISAVKKKDDAETRLLLGLAHHRIIETGSRYIRRGWITFEEYADFMKYLVEPYSVYGGNGMAEKIIEKVKALETRAYSVGYPDGRTYDEPD